MINTDWEEGRKADDCFRCLGALDPKDPCLLLDFRYGGTQTGVRKYLVPAGECSTWNQNVPPKMFAGSHNFFKQIISTTSHS